MAAHIQGDSGTSAWIEPGLGSQLIPEPSSLAFIALMVASWSALRRARD